MESKPGSSPLGAAVRFAALEQSLFEAVSVVLKKVYTKRPQPRMPSKVKRTFRRGEDTEGAESLLGIRRRSLRTSLIGRPFQS